MHDVILVDVTGYTKKVLVNGDVKPTPNTVLAEVLEVLSVPDNVVLGHTFTVDKPSYDTHDLVVNLDVSVELDDDDLEAFIRAIFDGGSALVGFDFDGVLIGDTLTKETLYSSFYLIDYVQSVEITEDGSEIEDLAPTGSGYVLSLGDVTINQTVVE